MTRTTGGSLSECGPGCASVDPSSPSLSCPSNGRIEHPLLDGMASLRSWMYGLIFAFYVPLTLWAFAFRGPMAAFWVGWAVAVTTTVTVTILGVVGALRSPIKGGPPPSAGVT